MVNTMARIEFATTRTISRYILVFGLLLLFMIPIPFIIIYVFSLDLPLPVTFSLIGLFTSPFSICAVYLGWQQLALPKEKQQTRGFRYWIVTYFLLVLLILYYTFLAFVFEILTPNLSLAYRMAMLPMLTILITLLVLTRTRLRQQVERLLERLLHGRSAE
jgi:hypothetical protein